MAGASWPAIILSRFPLTLPLRPASDATASNETEWLLLTSGTTGAPKVVNHSLAGYAVMAVTDEPGPDGSTAPTQQPQLYGNLG